MWYSRPRNPIDATTGRGIRLIKQIDRNTGMCMSLAARPGNFGCRFFNYLFGELDINFIYRATAPKDLGDAVRAIRALNIRGSALSMPYKEQAIPLLDDIDPAAKNIGAINTIVNTDGVLKGYNTDFLGVKKCLSEARIDKNAKVILLGSGGMARAIVYALHELNFANTTVVGRNQSAREELAGKYHFHNAAEVGETAADLLINATPIGMAPDPEDTMSFSEQQIARAKYVMESVSDPIETGLIRTARSLEKQVITGFDIIVNQAVEQFKLYFERDLDIELARRAATHARK
jgi:shikimate dehydrogenase